MATPKKGRTWRTQLDIVGLRFRWKKDARATIARLCDKSDISGIRLVREPGNPADPNAVMVVLPERIMGGRQLGYLHRQTAELLAPKFDKGILEVVSAKLLVLDGPDHNTGTIEVLFRDKPVAKPKTGVSKGKVTTS